MRGAAIAVAAAAALALPSSASAAICGFTNSHVNTPVPIGVGTVSKSLYIPRGATSNRNLQDVDIRLKIVHPNVADLDITVTHAGRTVVLSSDNGGTGQNYTDTIFDDEAAGSVIGAAAPFTGRFRPEAALSTFDGLPTDGVWTINVTDDTGEADGGGDPPPQDLVYWGVDYDAEVACPSTDPACDEQGGPVGVPIGDLTTSTSPRTLSGSGQATDVDVRVSIDAAFDEDVDIRLKNVATTVVLSEDNGGSGDNYVNTIFDDSAASLITAGSPPFTGSFRPEGDLSDLNGRNLASTWSLEIHNDNSSATPGDITVLEWGIRVWSSATCVDPDGDVVWSATDNCDDTANVGQENYEGDAQGDICDADDDNDSYADTADACPRGDRFGAPADYDADGCKDIEDADDDNDGVADTADGCPRDIASTAADTDRDGCKDFEDADDDNDTVADAADNCPVNSNKDQRDRDRDKLGDACDPDDDGDGVIDSADNCPTSANPGRQDSDRDGLGDTCDPSPRVSRLAPKLAKFKLSRRTFAAARRGGSLAAARRKPKVGTTISYTTSLASTTRFTVLRVTRGAKKGKRCVKRRKGAKGKSCKRLVKVGTFTHADKAGTVKLKFTGRVKRRALPPGRYVLRARPSNAGGAGAIVTASFRIVRR